MLLVAALAGCGGAPTTAGWAQPGFAAGEQAAVVGPTTAATPALDGAGPPVLVGRYRAVEAQDASMRPPDEVERLSLTFGDGTVSVWAGCNHITASFTVDDEDRLDLTDARSTVMACSPPAVMAMEGWFLGLLGQSPMVILRGDRLVLDSSDRSVVLVADG